MKNRRCLYRLTRAQMGGLIAVLLGGALLAGAAHAQREPRNDMGGMMVFRAEGFMGEDGGMPHARVLTPEEQQRAREEMRRLQSMTPAQREQFFQQRRAQAQAQQQEDIREVLAVSGEEDEAKQDLILAFIKQQRALRRPLNQRRRELAQALLAGKLSDKEALEQGQELRAAIEKSKTEYEAALKELDEKVQYSAKPRLQVLLQACGVLDDTVGFTVGPAGLESLVPPRIGPGM